MLTNLSQLPSRRKSSRNFRLRLIWSSCSKSTTRTANTDTWSTHANSTSKMSCTPSILTMSNNLWYQSWQQTRMRSWITIPWFSMLLKVISQGCLIRTWAPWNSNGFATLYSPLYVLMLLDLYYESAMSTSQLPKLSTIKHTASRFKLFGPS